MPHPIQHVHVIINPGAGQPKPILQPINSVFRAHHVSWQASITQQPGDAQRFAREAVANGADLVIACGGDGTVMEVANGMVHTDVPMMILPGGTNNVLAAEFDIPNDFGAALEQIFSREPRPIDLGQIGERYFLMRAEVGITGTMNAATTRELKDQMGTMAYLMGAAIASHTQARTRYRLSLDGEDVEVEGISCNVVNTRRLGSNSNLVFSQRVTPEDGLLDIIVFDTRMDSLVANIARIMKLRDDVGAYHWQAREVQVASEVAQDVWCDGEPFGTTPTTIRVVPGGIRMLCLA